MFRFFNFQKFPTTIALTCACLFANFLCASLGTAVAAKQTDFEPASRKIKVISTNLNGFGVPFKVDENNQQFIEVHLYFSKDNGQTWQFYDRKPTSEREFPFRADGDGEYCFALRTLDVNRRLLPEGDIKYPELKIIVDTDKPELDFRIESDPAGRVACRWKAIDKNLNADSVKIQYRSLGSDFKGPATPWKTVPIELNGTARNGIYADQIAWWPDTTSEVIEVQLQVADFAGNVTVADRDVTVAKTTWRHRAKSSTLDSQFNQRPPTGTGYGNESTTSSAKPPNVICENGVCRIVPKEPQTTAEALENEQWQRTIAPLNVANNRPPANNSPLANNPTNNAPPRATPPVPAQKTQWTINPNPELNQQDQFRRNPFQTPNNFEGSPPPPPGDWTQEDESFARQAELSLRNQNRPATSRSRETSMRKPFNQQGQPNSIGWASEVQRGQPNQVESVGSTLSPSQSILPDAQSNNQPNRVTDQIVANPAQTTKEGDRVISQSTTTWPSNQFSGPPASNIVALPPQLAPNAQSLEQNIGDPRTESSQQYADTGFQPIQPQPIPTRQSTFRRNESDRNNSIEHGRIIRGQPSENRSDANGPVTQVAQSLTGLSDSNTQIISSKRFQLNYDIDAIDPSGVGQIDLWMTRDRGKTWHVWGQDPDNVSPFPVEVQEEGLYGFRIVVRSRDGLTGRGPMSGDSPDMWILVDVQSPLTQITSVPYGRDSEAGKLVINYRVSDSHLSLRPVRIYWSPNPTSDWTTIAEGLRNEERFVWKVPRNVPDRIFLRLEAHDKAGNVGTHNLSQAIDVSGLVPRGTIYGVVPVGN